MPLLGPAALLLCFDIAPEAVAEHDDWHTHEHLPERLSLPGFLRGSRWVAVEAEPRYVVLYEVAALATLTSAPYLERLNEPSEWTTRMMPHYRGMTRGLCSIRASEGTGLGGFAYVVRLTPRADATISVTRWLLEDVLPGLPAQRGLVSAHLLEGAVGAPMTEEQRIRGADATVAAALLIMGYAPDALIDFAATRVTAQEFAARGATVTARGLYRLDCVVTHADVGA